MTDDNDDETEEHRYLFIVRQQFGEEPIIDSFYKLSMPAGITGDQAQVMTKLNDSWCKKEIAEDTQSLNGMQLRLRFNMDMYQKVCLVRSTTEIAAEDLEHIIQSKHERGTLMSFLDESAIK